MLKFIELKRMICGIQLFLRKDAIQSVSDNSDVEGYHAIVRMADGYEWCVEESAEYIIEILEQD